MRLIAALLLLLRAAIACGAEPLFEVASADGRSWIAPGRFVGKPSVFLFWDTECASCLDELHDLEALRAAFTGAEFVAVSLSPRDATRRTLARFNLPTGMIVANGSRQASALQRMLGNPDGALPFSAMFRGDGALCATHRGTLTAAALERATALCGAR